MKVAVLSDIHGNDIALECCVETALSRGIDTFLFLGDYAGELACPREVMEYLYRLDRQYSCHFVRGNKEEYWLNYRADGEKTWKDKDSTTGALLYSYGELTKCDLDFYESLPIARKIQFDNLPPIEICHGSPRRVNEKLLPGAQITFEIMDSLKESEILCGHTHIQGKITHNGKRVLNPGSVGLPMESGGQAQFMIMHGLDQEWQEEFVSLSYDVESAVRKLHERGLFEHAPSWSMVTEKILRDGGKLSHGAVLNRAMELCQAERGACIWPDVPEKYWRQAVQEFFT